MADTWSLTTKKRMTYRGSDHIFSNTYHFQQTPLPPASSMQAAAENLMTQEKAIFPSSVDFVGWIAHVSTSHIAYASKDYLTPYASGTFVPASGDEQCPGDVAATVRWSTADFTTRGKRIYLRKYYHVVFRSSGDPDALASDQSTAILDLADFLVSPGITVGVNDYPICGPRGAAGASPVVAPELTTRTLLRRGKRPH